MPSQTVSAIRNPARLAVLRRLQLLDTPEEEAFDRLTRFAARKLKVPIALVNLIDEHRQFFKSAIGLHIRELPIGTGICSYALTTREPLLLEDARRDSRFSSNPIVTEHDLVAYIGVPLITSTGHALGTFCVVDGEPRCWRQPDLETVRNLAGAVVTEIELRLDQLDGEQGPDDGDVTRQIGDTARPSLLDLKRQIAWMTHNCLSIGEDFESAADWGDEAAAAALVGALVTNLFTLSHMFWPGGRRMGDQLIMDHAQALRESFDLRDDSPLHWASLGQLGKANRFSLAESEAALDPRALTLEVEGESYDLKSIIEAVRSLWAAIAAETDRLSGVERAF
jgi:hypothetical protein